MRLTVRHYYPFGLEGELGPQEWDAIRGGAHPAFRLPPTREEWEAATSRSPAPRRAEDVARLCSSLGVREIASYGVGTAALELSLVLEAPQLELTCTEYALETVERLRTLLPEATVVQHDLAADPPLPAQLHLLHRVDAELTDAQWRELLPRFAEPVLFIPGEVRRLPALLLHTVQGRMRSWTRCGYSRTLDAFRSLWRDSHAAEELAVGELRGFLLTPRA